MFWQGAAKEFISSISPGKLLILGRDSKLIPEALLAEGHRVRAGLAI
jgi:hypothetical protein